MELSGLREVRAARQHANRGGAHETLTGNKSTKKRNTEVGCVLVSIAAGNLTVTHDHAIQAAAAACGQI
ncbi:unnamed protein product [Pleuronectes platessa]|uniref:Uncharacterized protein n=1 Tax=Pleuronectes platessa TaxID=8262 RepID=A0A9N7TGV3_PLEPL|nr:unnamed protein product [Pleuronectes platessa]